MSTTTITRSTIVSRLATLLLSAVLGLSIVSSSQAATIEVGQWYEFEVNAGGLITGCGEISAPPGACSGSAPSLPFSETEPGNPIMFTLTVPGFLTIVDGDVPGDTYTSSFATSVPPVAEIVEIRSPGTEGTCATPDDCNANPNFYRGVARLEAGTYTVELLSDDVTGSAAAGFGFVRVDPVPEPSTMILLGGGLAAMGLVYRRRRAA